MAFGIDDAVAAGLKVLDKFIPDPAAKAKAEDELRNALQAWDKQQTDVNAIEAANANVFVSGWRPAIGWSCAFAFAFLYVVSPIISWGLLLFGKNLPLPSFNADALMSMTFGMLGLAGMRSWEKYKGLTR
jgi:hypothetical protein